MVKVDVMIAGAHKAGTTTMARYLEAHPSIVSHPAVEFGYFVNGYRHETFGEAYERAFDQTPQPGQLVLAKSVDVMVSASAAARLRAHNPDVKVVVMLREPIARAYSAYWYEVAAGRQDQNETFAQALASEAECLASGSVPDPSTAYFWRGLYAEQIEMLYETFGSGAVHVVLLEDFSADIDRHGSQLCDWLGLEAVPFCQEPGRQNMARRVRSQKLSRLTRSPIFRPLAKRLPAWAVTEAKNVANRLNRSAESIPPLADAIEAGLRDRYQEPNKRLSELLDRELWTP